MEISKLYFKGDISKGEFYSVALTTNYQQADTGTKMIHVGKKQEVELFQKEFLQVIHKIVIVV